LQIINGSDEEENENKESDEESVDYIGEDTVSVSDRISDDETSRTSEEEEVSMHDDMSRNGKYQLASLDKSGNNASAESSSK